MNQHNLIHATERLENYGSKRTQTNHKTFTPHSDRPFG
jgi:hypothetical protein